MRSLAQTEIKDLLYGTNPTFSFLAFGYIRKDINKNKPLIGHGSVTSYLENYDRQTNQLTDRPTN